MQAVTSSSRAVGDSIQVYDTLNGHQHARPVCTGTITKVVKKFITVKFPLGTEYRFNRCTGFIVGYNFPTSTQAVAPETCG